MNNMNHPYIDLNSLDYLWFQVSGTICNLHCTHCFNNSSPLNRNFGFLTLDECEKYLEEGVKLGVKEFYFTGGETFANKEIFDIIERAMAVGPVTVLTNGTLIRPERAARLAEIANNSIYTLEIRVSIDGYTEEMNDAIRGKGAFEKAMNGVRLLYENGFLPIISVVKSWNDNEDDKVLKEFYSLLKEHGYKRPRIKILPTLKIGKEALRSRSYEEYEYVYEEMMTEDFDKNQLICYNSRAVTSKGVYVCPLLIESDDAKLADNLEDSMKPYELKHQACYTCYLYGAICSNFTTGRRNE